MYRILARVPHDNTEHEDDDDEEVAGAGEDTEDHVILGSLSANQGTKSPVERVTRVAQPEYQEHDKNKDL